MRIEYAIDRNESIAKQKSFVAPPATRLRKIGSGVLPGLFYEFISFESVSDIHIR